MSCTFCNYAMTRQPCISLEVQGHLGTSAGGGAEGGPYRLNQYGSPYRLNLSGGIRGPEQLWGFAELRGRICLLQSVGCGL